MFEHIIRRSFSQLIKPIFKMRPLSNKQCSNAFSTAKLFDLRAERLVWIDMEMTGLNVDQDNIMEVACIVTDTDLNIVAEGPEIVINHAKETLENMHEWCVKQHGKTGLTEACLKSQTSLEQAEDSIMDFLRAHVTPHCSPLAGNSVYMDRFFLIKYMPK
uniref:Exonuclease domain-containing protein n=1 Tax=Dendroctonus ponderosae TaxID=77166 RepID=A0AAR5QH01_DENPD